MQYKDSDYFVLSSSSNITKGYNRSLIQDFLRNSTNLISNEYYDLIEIINRKRIADSLQLIDEDSVPYFREFLEFMFSNEYALYVEDLALFPLKSNVLGDEHVLIKDCIIQIDEKKHDHSRFVENLIQLDKLSCDDIQLWIISDSDEAFIINILEAVSNYSFLCIEVNFNFPQRFDRSFFIKILDSYSCISKIFLYNAEASNIYNHVDRSEGNHPLLIGQIISTRNALNPENCGVINYDNLSFGVEYQFKINQKYNGCLYKKLTIDTNGNIKNCPHLSQDFGKISLETAITDSEFQKRWFIKKDDIEICKDCEFRYNCTDCRAFVVNQDNQLSKPLKCGYNPYTNQWAD